MFITCVCECAQDVQAGLALVRMLFMCSLNVMPLPYITPRIVESGCSEVGVTGIGALESVACGSVLYSLLYDVISVSVNLLVETFSLFVVIQFSNSCMHVCCCLAAVSRLECCVRIVRLSAYESICVFGSLGVGMS